MKRAAGTLRLLGLLALALLGSGCAALKSATATTPEAAASAPAAPRAPAVQVEIDAPAPLKALLERHLDLVRLGALSQGEALGEFELTRLIDATPSQARSLAETLGHFDARVTIERSPRAATGDAERVRVLVQPGELTRVSRVDIEVEGELARAVEAGDAAARATLADLRQAWPLGPGAVFRNADWSDAKTAAIARLRAAGYAAAVWGGTAAEVDTQARTARLFLVADAGPQFRRGEIVVEGLRMHDLGTVLDLAGIGPGEPVTETRLLDYQDRLVKAGLFELVAVTMDTDPAQAAGARVLVRVAELSRHQLTAGVGVSASAGPRTTVEHVDRRVLGFAAIARNKAEWGQARQAWDGELSTHPGPDLRRNLVGVTIERLKTDTDTVLSQRVRLGRAEDSQRIERYYFGEYLRNTRRTDSTRTESNAATLNYHWVRRDIDNPLLPTDGLTLSLQGAIGRAGGSDDGRGTFGRAYARATLYRPLGTQWFGQARLELGQILGRSSVNVPETLAFRAGGDDSVRGYAHRSLGPLVDGAVGSGRVLATASIEAARPFLVSMPSLWGAVFVDAGQAADRWSDLKPVFGAGVGLRWRSPVGPLKIDLAYGETTRRVRLHFSVGIVF